jgi:threonine dehydrogenase-like Zn-dependent dehydrogenase
MSATTKVPEKMLAWQLYGAGFEKFGKEDKPVELPVPKISDEELLVRIDAIGLCFSDVKLIRAGETHPRVYSKDLSKEPVIPGHEAVMTVVKVGEKLKSKFKAGQRFIIQADVYYKGVGWAYGYAIDGGMAQYSVIGEKILNGDEGCYLLPIADSVPSAIAALFEPWTCVLASYLIGHRAEPKDGGKTLFAFECQCPDFSLGKLFEAAKPAEVQLFGVSAKLEEAVRKAYPKAKIGKLDALPAEGAFDDIVIGGAKTKAFAEAAGKLGAVNAVISYVAPELDADIQFDVGSIHYKGWFYQGSASKEISKAYGRNLRSGLKKGGVCWLPGGAGAMGQMHSQLAVESPDGPAKILVTDMDNTRLEHVRELLEPGAKKRGVEFKLLNPTSFKSPAEFDAALKAFAPEGFDDIVMLVPVPAVVSGSAKFLKADGLMNIFAGIPAGKEAALSLKSIAANGARFIGSSGSRTEHLRKTVELVEAGHLNPSTALAAIGGMKDLKKGLDAVANAKFPGKTVIFPNCPDMPLTQVENLASLDAALPGTLGKDGSYTVATEKAIDAKFSA